MEKDLTRKILSQLIWHVNILRLWRWKSVMAFLDPKIINSNVVGSFTRKFKIYNIHITSICRRGGVLISYLPFKSNWLLGKTSQTIKHLENNLYQFDISKAFGTFHSGIYVRIWVIELLTLSCSARLFLYHFLISP